MAEASVPVDLFNPGQVFACLGLAEAADVLLGEAEGAFDWSHPSAVRFHLRAAGGESPVKTALAFLDRAQAVAVAPRSSQTLGGWKESWGPPPRELDRGLGYPFPDPDSPATLVCELSDGQHALRLEHWGEASAMTGRDNVKFWAGAGGYPGAGLARDALDLVRGQAASAAHDPFALAAPQSSSFRLDWRRDYIPLDAGFSLNAHEHIVSVGYPLVELFAALGLAHARPLRPERWNKLLYRYGVVGRSEVGQTHWLPPRLLRAALGTTTFPWPMRTFRVRLNWPGKEGQARSITTVTEEG